MKTFRLMVLPLILLLAACQGSPQTQPVTTSPAQASAPQHAAKSAAPASYWVDGQPQSDSQGAVTVELRPNNLNNPASFIEFAVAMNTHSVNLDMNLAQLSTLTTDSGLEVQAVSWDAPSGGHHVRGVLRFPAVVDGQPVLNAQTRRVTVTIRNVDAPVRTFTWQRNTP
ncbi:MAG: hypothetical protein Fur0018_14600 [Anaerolineales bacterium]